MAHEQKSAKTFDSYLALKAILTDANVSDEELMTAITGAESLLNSRPLKYQTANVDDDVPLTPNHFLHGQMGGSFAPETVDQTTFSPRKPWQRVQELVMHFWQRWLKEWLPGLNPTTKWHKEKRNSKVGDIVIVISPDNPRAHWPLAKVIQVFPGKDGKVRVAQVQTGQKLLKRPVNKLCLLENFKMAAGDIIMVYVYFDMVLKTTQDEEYQLTCVTVKEGEDVHETIMRHSRFLLVS